MADLTPTLTPAEQEYFDLGDNGSIPTEVTGTEITDTPDTPTEEVSRRAPRPDEPTPQSKNIAQPKADMQTGDKPTVPLAALTEEREARKAFKAEVDELKASQKLMVDAFTKFMDKVTPKEAPPAPVEIPDVNENPLAHLLAKIALLENALQGVGTVVQQTTEQQQQQEYVQALMAVGKRDEDEFAKDFPDYGDATVHLKTFRWNQIKALRPELSDAEIEQTLLYESLQLAEHARNSDKNIGKVFYDLAVSAGYVRKEEKKDGASAGSDPADVVRKAAAGQAQATGLGGTRGATVTPTTVAKALELSPADFDKFMQTKEGRELMGV